MGIKSKELMTVAGVVPKLRLGTKKAGGGVNPTGPHRVRLIEEKIIKAVDPQDGKEKEYMEYYVEENGEKKVYRTKIKNREGKLSYFVQEMSQVPEGSEVILEMKKAGVKNYIEISPVNGTKVEVSDEDMNDDGGETIDIT